MYSWKQEAVAREESVRVQHALSEQVAQLTGALSEHEEAFRSQREELQAELDEARRALGSSGDELRQAREEAQIRDAALEGARAALEAGEQGLREAVSAREQLLGLLQEKEAQMAAIQADRNGLLIELEGKKTAAQQRYQSLEGEVASVKVIRIEEKQACFISYLRLHFRIAPSTDVLSLCLSCSWNWRLLWEEPNKPAKPWRSKDGSCKKPRMRQTSR